MCYSLAALRLPNCCKKLQKRQCTCNIIKHQKILPSLTDNLKDTVQFQNIHIFLIVNLLLKWKMQHYSDITIIQHWYCFMV